MKKTILITGATDGIGLETAKKLAEGGHTILLHGRSAAKLATAEKAVSELAAGGAVECYEADLSSLQQVLSLVAAVTEKHRKLDVLINNAGVLNAANPITADGMDIRFVVNTIAPYLLTRRLLPLLGSDARVVNLSSAAQAPVDPKALSGATTGLDDMAAYAQSKLAITMWSRTMALTLAADGPAIYAVNPGSLLASKMVKDGFGVPGKDLGIGVDILVRASLSDEFANRSGEYFDNDAGQFAAPHPDGLDEQKSQAVVRAIESVLAGLG